MIPVSKLSIPQSIIGKCRLVKLHAHTKRAIEEKWQTVNNYSPEDPKIQFWHGDCNSNYGVMPTNGLMIFDCDTDMFFSAIPEEWKQTPTVISGRSDGNGKHLYFLCRDAPKEKILLRNPDDPTFQIGDVRGSGSEYYVVGAGSIHPDSKNKYYWINEALPLYEVKWQDVKDVIKAFPQTVDTPKPKYIPPPNSTSTLTETLNLHIEDFAMPVNGKKKSNGEIIGAHPIHGSTTGNNFSINVEKNTWFCFRCHKGGDPISWLAYAHCGAGEGDLSDSDFLNVKDWLRNNGYKDAITMAEADAVISTQNDFTPEQLHDFLSPPQITQDRFSEHCKALKESHRLPAFPKLSEGIFKEYMSFASRVTYSLTEFHFASLLSIVSMAIGRRAIVRAGMAKIYPNIFAMVIGHTTISGKSVACNMAVNNFSPSILFEEPLAKTNSISMLCGTMSEAAVIQQLNDVWNNFWYYDDAGGFFDDALSWNAHILGTMCTLYDCSAVERTLSKRGKNGEQYKWSCPSPFVSILWNTTIKNLEEAASAKLFNSGFFPRIMWFIGEGGQVRKNSDITEEDDQIIAGLKEEVSGLRKLLHDVPPDGIVFGVNDLIEDWKISNDTEHLEEDDTYRAACGRGFVHVYKIATILALLDRKIQSQLSGVYPLKLKIPDEHATTAIKIVEQYLLPRAIRVAKMSMTNDMKNHQVQVLKAIESYSGVATKSQILRYTHMNHKDMEAAVSTLIVSEEVETYTKREEGAKKDTLYIMKRI